jgi:hypothetical protein
MLGIHLEIVVLHFFWMCEEALSHFPSTCGTPILAVCQFVSIIDRMYRTEISLLGLVLCLNIPNLELLIIKVVTRILVFVILVSVLCLLFP